MLAVLVTISVTLACRHNGGYTPSEVNEAYYEGVPYTVPEWPRDWLSGSQAESLVDAYQEDRARANQKYNGRVVLLAEPPLRRSNGSARHAPYVDYYVPPRMDAGGEGAVIRCYFRRIGHPDDIQDEAPNDFWGPWIWPTHGVVVEQEDRNPDVIEVMPCWTPRWYIEFIISIR